MFASLLASLVPKTNTPIQNAANYVSETVQDAGAQASKAANKEVAKDSNASISTRANAAVDALGDKKDEYIHNTKADVHKGEQHSPKKKIWRNNVLITSTEAAKH